MKRSTSILATLILFQTCLPSWGQAPAHPDPSQYVTREEYNKLLKELEAIKAQLGATASKQTSQATETDESFDYYDKQLSKLKSTTKSLAPGTRKELLTGFAFARYTDPEGGNGSFSAGVNPIFLWKPSDRLFFESEVEFGLEDGETDVDLEFAQANYILNDYMTLGAGKFLNPGNFFMERLHPAWINKFPNFPLPFTGSTRLQAPSQVGAEIRGGVPAGPTKFEYAFYLSNGPTIDADPASENLGSLSFKNFEDSNNNKAVGGRIGFFPVPELEVGYSFEAGQAGTSGVYDGLTAVTHTVDANYVRQSDLIKGSVKARAQLIWLNIENPGIAPLDFHNHRNGGYAQVSYRPTEIDIPFLKNLEAVYRYGWLNLPSGAPNNTDQRRSSIGLDYWLTPTTALKLSYQTTRLKDHPTNIQHENEWLMEVAMGF